jgi:hypothetical protein
MAMKGIVAIGFWRLDLGDFWCAIAINFKKTWCNSTSCLVVDASPPNHVVATSWLVSGAPFSLTN